MHSRERRQHLLSECAEPFRDYSLEFGCSSIANQGFFFSKIVWLSAFGRQQRRCFFISCESIRMMRQAWKKCYELIAFDRSRVQMSRVIFSWPEKMCTFMGFNRRMRLGGGGGGGGMFRVSNLYVHHKANDLSSRMNQTSRSDLISMKTSNRLLEQ